MHVRRGEEVDGPHDAGQGEIGVEAHVIELVADVGMLADPQGEDVVALFHRVGDVGLEGRGAAFVRGHELAVDPDLGAAVDALEIELDPSRLASAR